MRIGLALGAGGVVGASWMIGALEALEAQTGFRAADADEVLGTSVGSLIAAMVAAGVPTAAMAAYASGESRTVGELRRPRRHRAAAGADPVAARPRIDADGARRRAAPHAALTGLLPRGVVRTDAIRELVERAIGTEWPAGGELRIVACDYASGERVSFDGGGGSRRRRPGEAVAASCAIPAFYEPVQIGAPPLHRRRPALALEPRPARLLRSSTP